MHPATSSQTAVEHDLAGPLPLNATVPEAERREQAISYLQENPSENVAAASLIFNVNQSSLYTMIRRGSLTSKSHGGHNKVLQEHQTRAVHQFIREILSFGMQPTLPLAYGAICGLKRAYDENCRFPTYAWFLGWWKKNRLHKIKSKPLAIVRMTAQSENDVLQWFHHYRETIERLGIKKRNIFNFDEAGFRIGCPKGESILVPSDVREFYALSPENRRTVTIFEAINASGHKPPPPFVVVQGKQVMADWFPPELDDKVYVEASESGFTSNEIAIKWLRHFIEHSESGPEADWKLLIMDNHGNHETPEFIKLANDNRILPYPLIPHMTHCMQPLDVGIFQPYKHWHDTKIKEAVANLDVEYCICSFLRDLGSIRESTFKKTTIRHAFEKSGIWPVNAQKALEQVKTFSPPEPTRASTPDLPAQPMSLRGAAEVDLAWLNYEQSGKVDQMLGALSSPTRSDMASLISRNREALAHSVLSEAQLGNLKRKRQDDLQRKMGSRKRVQQFGGLTAADAHRKLEEKSERKKRPSNEKARGSTPNW